MAATPIELSKLPQGLTLTCDVYPRGSDTVDQAGIILTEATNRKGTYSGTVTAASTGLITAKIKLSGTVIAEVTGSILDTTATFILEDDDRVIDRLGAPAGASVSVDIAAIPTSKTVTVSATSPTLQTLGGSGTINVHRGDKVTWQLLNIGTLTGRTGEKLWFTVKDRKSTASSDTDSEALLQITELTGAKILNGATTTASFASMTVDDEPTGDVTFVLEKDITDALPIVSNYVYDIQMIDSAGKPKTLTEGKFQVTADVTRSNT